MIVSSFIPKQGICSLVVESPDDLWILRRLIGPGDTIVTKSSRVSKKEDEYSRPDRGERIKVTIALVVESVSLDSSVGRLRVRGRISESSDDSVSTAGSHSVSVSPGYGLTLRKSDWTPLDTTILNSAKASRTFLVVTMDRREAGIGTLSGSHLSITATIDSGASGKGGQEVDQEPYLRKIVGVLANTWRSGDLIVVAGPGHTKLALANRIAAHPEMGKSYIVLEGFDLSGADGVRNLVKFEGFKKVASDSVLVEVQEIVEQVIKRITQGDTKVAYTLARVRQAAMAGAVESCVVSDDVFTQDIDEQELVDTLNKVEQLGGRVYLCDSSLETGKQVSSFGGMVATLRYSFKPY
ncbi:MAG: pelota family protein [Nitrososphaerota archaeon]|nr:pelota family protein [Nitrososphaerota archaeon]